MKTNEKNLVQKNLRDAKAAAKTAQRCLRAALAGLEKTAGAQAAKYHRRALLALKRASDAENALEGWAEGARFD